MVGKDDFMLKFPDQSIVCRRYTDDSISTEFFISFIPLKKSMAINQRWKNSTINQRYV